MENKPRYTFPAKEKLKSRKQIEQLFREGKSFSHFPFRMIWQQSGGNGALLQTGFTVSSKNFKKAVDRNRIKRIMREAYRLQKNGLMETLVASKKQLSIFFIYVGNELPEYQLIHEKTGTVLKRLIKIIDEKSVADT